MIKGCAANAGYAARFLNIARFLPGFKQESTLFSACGWEIGALFLGLLRLGAIGRNASGAAKAVADLSNSWLTKYAHMFFPQV